MSQMSHVYLGLPWTSWDVLARSQLHSLVPCPRCPTYPWDYLGHPGMSQLRASYIGLSHVYLGLPWTSWDVPAKSHLHSLVPCPRCPMFFWDYVGQVRSSKYCSFVCARSMSNGMNSTVVIVALSTCGFALLKRYFGEDGWVCSALNLCKKASKAVDTFVFE